MFFESWRYGKTAIFLQALRRAPPMILSEKNLQERQCWVAAHPRPKNGAGASARGLAPHRCGDGLRGTWSNNPAIAAQVGQLQFHVVTPILIFTAAIGDGKHLEREFMKTKRISFLERQSLRSRRIGSPHSAGSKRGFTLVELLVVIAIIAILGALFFPVLGKIQKRADGVKCANNLKQVGAAIILYAADHDGMLPGPVSGGQVAAWGTTTTQLMFSLVDYLGPYGHPVPPYSVSFSVNPGIWYSPLFECPSARRIILTQTKTLDSSTSYLLPTFLIPGIATLFPYGYPTKPGDPPKPPMKLVNLPSLQKVAAMSDVDQLVYGKGSSTVAAAPAHGSYRNTLFFDGHVEAVPVKP